ncbi:6-pyruvoyl tetrahydropterin synthase [compost metagenome]
MAKNEVLVCKTFSFDSSHQLIGHCGKCANIHGHTYKLEVKCKGYAAQHPDVNDLGFLLSSDEYTDNVSNEGFVIDFYRLKLAVNELIVDRLDHAFIAMGNEPALETIKASGVKVVVLGFRTTVENMASYICWRLLKAGLPIHSVRMWETPTGWAEVLASEIDWEKGPTYRTIGQCDLDEDNTEGGDSVAQLDLPF